MGLMGGEEGLNFKLGVGMRASGLARPGAWAQGW